MLLALKRDTVTRLFVFGDNLEQDRDTIVGGRDSKPIKTVLR
jgi:hypothetical protein